MPSGREAYKAKTGIGMNYQSIGSGGGIAQIKAKTVDFGASDMPLKPDDLHAAGLMQFPAIIGGVVPVVNIEGIAPGQLKLTGPVAGATSTSARSRSGTTRRSPTLNPGVKLPDEPITVVRRSDGSGTTFILTDYLSKVSPEWKSKVGSSTAVAWPEGVGGKGNEGVAAYVQRIKGVDRLRRIRVRQAEQDDYALVQNKEGQYRAAGRRHVPGRGGLRRLEERARVLSDPHRPAGQGCWPISGASFILMHVKQDKPENAAEVLKFFDWAFKNGQKMAEELDYVPLPDSVVQGRSRTPGRSQVKDGAGKSVWNE